MKRTPVQLIHIGTKMYALCNDGSIWCFYPGIATIDQATGLRHTIENSQWLRVADIPSD